MLHVPQMQGMVSLLVIVPWKRRFTSSLRIYDAHIVHPSSSFWDSLCLEGGRRAGLQRGCFKLQPSIPLHPLAWGCSWGQMHLLDCELVHSALQKWFCSHPPLDQLNHVWVPKVCISFLVKYYYFVIVNWSSMDHELASKQCFSSKSTSSSK